MKIIRSRKGLGRHLREAFTLMEVVMALAVLGTMGAGAYVGFNSLNTYAISSTLSSEAQTSAQNQIDLILSQEPFDVTNNKILSSLALGTDNAECLHLYRSRKWQCGRNRTHDYDDYGHRQHDEFYGR